MYVYSKEIARNIIPMRHYWTLINYAFACDYSRETERSRTDENAYSVLSFFCFKINNSRCNAEALNAK